MESSAIQVSTTTRASFWEPTNVLCIKDGVLLQLWLDRYAPLGDSKEWRPIPTYEEAANKYQTYLPLGAS